MDLNNLKSEPIVVLGGGFGGLATVIALLARSDGTPVILIDKGSRFLFKPLLYELLSEELQLWEVAPKYSALAAELGFIFLQDIVIEIDHINRKLITSSRSELTYSQLVISTGVTTDYSCVKGLKEYAYGFSNLNDLYSIQQLVNEINSSSKYRNPLLISGAGPTGVELACKISDLVKDKLEIYLIDKGSKILQSCKSFNREKAIEAISKRNIKIYLNHFIKSIDKNNIELVNINNQNSNPQMINYSGLVWTAALKSDSLRLLHYFFKGNNKIQVNNFLQVNKCQNIFFVGDINSVEENPFPSSAQVAMQQGFLTAQNIISLRKGGQLKSFEFEDRGEMLSLGYGNASLTGYGFTLAGSLAFEIRRLVYLMRMPGRNVSVTSTGSWLFSKTSINRLFSQKP
tara:strand:- start:19052 stop:20254 length:1203 start_codon:yes stop_codon:yes gene_type:complete